MNESTVWTFGERFFLTFVCEAFLIFATALMWGCLQTTAKTAWLVKYAGLIRAIFWLALTLQVIGSVVSLVYGGHPLSSWPSLTITWISDWHNLAFLGLGLTCVAGAIYAAPRISRFFSTLSFVKGIEMLTNGMSGCLDYNGIAHIITGLIFLVIWIAVIALGCHTGQIGSWPSVALLVAIMIVLSFIFCAYETAIAILAKDFDNTSKDDLLSNWHEEEMKKKNDGRLSAGYMQIKTMSFELSRSYLRQEDVSFASLLALVALVDIGGVTLVASFVAEYKVVGFVNANGQMSKPALETILVTIPLVILGDLFGTMIGKRMPAKVLRRLAIFIWPFYFPMSCATRSVAEGLGFCANRCFNRD